MIKKMLSNAMLSIVMDKSAKEKLQAVREQRKSLKDKTKNKKKETPEEALVRAALGPKPEMAPAKPKPLSGEDREKLIRNAMAVHQQQSKVLDTLSPKEKKRLQLLAMHTMLGKDPG